MTKLVSPMAQGQTRGTGQPFGKGEAGWAGVAVGKGPVLMASAPHELKEPVGLSDTSTTSSYTAQLSSQEGSVRPWGTSHQPAPSLPVLVGGFGVRPVPAHGGRRRAPIP